MKKSVVLSALSFALLLVAVFSMVVSADTNYDGIHFNYDHNGGNFPDCWLVDITKPNSCGAQFGDGKGNGGDPQAGQFDNCVNEIIRHLTGKEDISFAGKIQTEKIDKFVNSCSRANDEGQTFETYILSFDVDEDGDGFFSEDDCNDSNALINPNATEICDGIDNNCDGNIDEGGVCGNSCVSTDKILFRINDPTN
jgi:hypothetical protein